MLGKLGVPVGEAGEGLNRRFVVSEEFLISAGRSGHHSHTVTSGQGGDSVRCGLQEKYCHRAVAQEHTNTPTLAAQRVGGRIISIESIKPQF